MKSEKEIHQKIKQLEGQKKRYPEAKNSVDHVIVTLLWVLEVVPLKTIT